MHPERKLSLRDRRQRVVDELDLYQYPLYVDRDPPSGDRDQWNFSELFDYLWYAWTQRLEPPDAIRAELQRFEDEYLGHYRRHERYASRHVCLNCGESFDGHSDDGKCLFGPWSYR